MKLETRIDKIFAPWDNKDSPGAAVAISKNGSIVFQKGYGLANLEYGIPNSHKTVFHVASVSKQFTAMSILLLAKEGLLNLDDEVIKFIPEFPKFEYPITIRHLIHHVSGLRDQWQLLVYGGWRMDDVITHEHIMKTLLKQRELNFKPGTKYLYCNSGYTLMAEIVKRITNESLTDYTNNNIFLPLSMNDTHFHDDHEQIVKNRAYSYSPYYNSFKKKILSYATVGATSLFTTTTDLLKWSMNFDEPKIGDKELIENMLTPYTLENGEIIDYACGLMVDNCNGEKTISHGGSDAGFRSYFLKFPTLGYTIVVLSNLSTAKPELLAKKIADEVVFGKKDKIKEVDNDPVSCSNLTGFYITEPGNIIGIEKENGNMYIRLPRQEKSTLTKVKDNTYRVDLINEVFYTRYDEQGSVEILLKPIYGRDVVGKKIDRRIFTNTSFKDYIGTFYSEELRTTYYIQETEDGLKITHRKISDTPLIMLEKDVFEGKYGFARLSFVRNDINKVIGFNLTGGRVKNIKFGKV